MPAPNSGAHASVPNSQPTLLSGFVSGPRAAAGTVLAPQLPVAKVLVDSPLPHLDRPFDYAVPAELDAAAQPGVRVKVRFAGQELSGYLLERTAHADTSAKLSPLGKVVGSAAVLTPAVRRLAESVAARYAGTISDVLRVAIPPRAARVDKEFEAGALCPAESSANQSDAAQSDAVQSDAAEPTAAESGGGSARAPAAPDESVLFAGYRHADSFLAHLRDGGSPRAVMSSLKGFGPSAWPLQIAAAVAAARAGGRGAIVVVPDYRDLERLEAALADVVPREEVARLTADDGSTPRYRNFLKLLTGAATVAIGTRSAAFAPVRNLGLVACWDDGDDLHLEQRAPYQHSREVLLLRAEQEKTALLLAAHTRSTEAQRLLDSGWAQPIEAERPAVRAHAPRIVASSDSYESARDPLARIARLPHIAWRTAKTALESGPVLVQVARAGYAPSLACQRCREAARCRHCEGPLAVGGPAADSVPTCRWCGKPERKFECRHCGATALRRTSIGASRTAEELGRAFPGVPVVSSSGDQVKKIVPDQPALVVATVGAEPVAAAGYAAALLLDGDVLLRRESLRAGEETFRRWLNAAALVRSAHEGGTVVVTARDDAVVGPLVRWDPAGYASAELALRSGLGLPPAVRLAALTGERHAVEAFLSAARLPASVKVVGPAPLEHASFAPPTTAAAASAGADAASSQHRILLFIPYASASSVAASLRAVKAAAAAKRTTSAVQVRFDGPDLL